MMNLIRKKFVTFDELRVYRCVKSAIAEGISRKAVEKDLKESRSMNEFLEWVDIRRFRSKYDRADRT